MKIKGYLFLTVAMFMMTILFFGSESKAAFFLLLPALAGVYNPVLEYMLEGCDVTCVP